MAGNGEDLRKLTLGQIWAGIDKIPASAKSGDKVNIGGLTVQIYRPPPPPTQNVTYSPRVMRIFEAGLQAFQQLKLEQALGYFSECTREEPHVAQGWANLGMNFLALRRFEEARQCLQRALVVFPMCLDAIMGLGMLEDGLGNYAKATEFYKELFIKFPWGKNYIIEIITFRLPLAERTGNWQLPIEIYLLGLKYWPGETLFWNMFATCLIDAGQYQESIFCGTYSSVLGDNFNCHFALGQVYARLKRYEYAAWHLQKYLENKVGNDPNLLALNENARRALREVVVAASNEGIKIPPTPEKNPWTREQEVLLRIHACEHCLKIVPEHSKGWYHLGTIHTQLLQWDAAIEAFRKAIQLFQNQNPHEIPIEKEWILYSLANAYLRAGELDRALRMITVVLETKKNGINWSLLAEIRLKRVELTEAEEAVRQAMLTNPKDLHYQGLLAKIRHQQGKTAEAIQIYERLGEDQWSGPHFLTELGDLYQSIGDETKARDAFQRAVDKKPDYKPALEKLGFETPSLPDQVVPISITPMDSAEPVPVPQQVSAAIPPVVQINTKEQSATVQAAPQPTRVRIGSKISVKSVETPASETSEPEQCGFCGRLLVKNRCTACGGIKCPACGSMNRRIASECQQCRNPLS